jgi:integrase
MAKDYGNDFDLTIWNKEALGLTDAQERLRQPLMAILSSSKLPVAVALRRVSPGELTPDDMRELERSLEKKEQGQWLKGVFEIIGKVVALQNRQRRPHLPFPRSLHTVKLERNPFGETTAIQKALSVVDAERILLQVRALLVKQGPGLSRTKQRLEVGPDQVKVTVALAVLSSVAHFGLLHMSMLVALVEALAMPGQSRERFGRYCFGYILSLPYAGVPNAERRLFLPDALSAEWLDQLKEEEIASVVAELQKLTNGHERHQRVEHFLISAVNDLLRRSLPEKKLTLKLIIEAGQMLAYVHLPPAIAALRCRKTVSHTPRPDVLRRIHQFAKVEQVAPVTPGPSVTEAELARLDAIVDDVTQVEPAWIHHMRDAFKADTPVTVIRALKEVRSACNAPGLRIVDFGIHLLDGLLAIKTAKRYSLLVAKRIGCRLADVDPVALDISELESTFREALEDDWDVDLGDGEEAPTSYQPATTTALRKFHAFLRRSDPSVQDFSELGPILRRRGLLAVDANFITVDEYERIIRFISNAHRIKSSYRRRFLSLIVTLAFRCGLRRAELFYLRPTDLGADDSIYVRGHKLRKLKTSNANRAIPAWLLLTPEEMGELKEFIHERLRAPRTGDSTFIFSRIDDSSIPLYEESVFGEIHGYMRSVLGDDSLRVHHLRHSFATLLAARLLPGLNEFARALFQQHPRTMHLLRGDGDDPDGFRRKLFLSSQISRIDLQAVSHLLGHGGPAVSVEHYVHCLDWFQIRHNSRVCRGVAATAIEISGRKKTTVHRRLQKGEQGNVG